MRKKIDYTGGDHSFKNWFKIMWQNTYIPIFLAALIALVFQIIKIEDCLVYVGSAYVEGLVPLIFSLIFMFLPLSILCIVAYKGFYQFWNDLKNGNKR
jgi:hypothetical protein